MKRLIIIFITIIFALAGCQQADQLEEIEKTAIEGVLEKNPQLSAENVTARVGKIREIDSDGRVLFEYEEGKISFKQMEDDLVNQSFVGKKVLTIGDDFLDLSYPAQGGLYSVVIIED